MGLFDELGKKFEDLGHRYANVTRPIVKDIPGAKWVGSKTGNLWNAGIKMTKPAQAVGIVGLALYSAAAGTKAGMDYKAQESAVASQQVGPIAATHYESSGARGNMGATGDLVFGLHNMRRGGA